MSGEPHTRADWRNNPDAPFYDLLHTLRTYVHPDTDDYDELVKIVHHNAWLQRFKEQHRTALLDPSQIPDPDAVFSAANYDDGNDLRFLRRLWRDLYPGENVPGGDDEFRGDLRRLIHGEIEDRPLPSTVIPYDDNPGVAATVDELQALGRRIWRRFYPGEPLP